MKCGKVYAVILMFAFFTSGKGQTQTSIAKNYIKSESKDVDTSFGPAAITRTIKQDRKGNIWMAAFDGVFQYDGNSFSNITSKVSSARFFSVLEDRKGNMWFGSIGSGVYYYDGKSFQNFTTKEGLLNNDVGSIYEDNKGNIWFGVFGGASCYDVKSFRNFIINGDSMNEDPAGKTFQDRPPYEVTSIIEDKTGKFWFGTRGNTFVYDASLLAGEGRTFTALTNNGKPFTNVRSIIEDKKGNIWLGGNDGLWRYDGSTFINVTANFIGYIYEDKNENIWTSSQTAKGWALSRYDARSLSISPFIRPTVTEITSMGGMIFGILEANDGSIWVGTLQGVERYEGKTVQK